MICVSCTVQDGEVQGTLLNPAVGYDLFMGYRVPLGEFDTGVVTEETVVNFFVEIQTFFG